MMRDLATLSLPTAAMVKEKAESLGFDRCGIARAEFVDPEGNLGQWLSRDYHSTMDWIAKAPAIRQDPRLKLPGAQSVVVVARNYYSPRPEQEAGEGRIARYAWGRDYHRALRKPLRRLSQFIDGCEDGARSYCSTDTGPVLERTWAARAGVGSVGKNSLALTRTMGSWFFLATVITTVKLDADEPAGDICGTCRACFEACPTGAIVEPYVVDANRCISYQTIENRGDVPEALHEGHGDWVFGCDVCQEVCPWNRFATKTNATDFLPRRGHVNPNLAKLLSMDEGAFNREFEGTAIRRAKHSGMTRNAAIALGNSDEAVV
ncbi:MAG: tRNA epoxyqueuosine(34) reductase QueG [Candidatus Hydrogenedentes bacterium]|nr:tRNA epoxyqueuosine(34) reductase QueG [Candidatus Hydrogenedentota bacterium]